MREAEYPVIRAAWVAFIPEARHRASAWWLAWMRAIGLGLAPRGKLRAAMSAADSSRVSSTLNGFAGLPSNRGAPASPRSSSAKRSESSILLSPYLGLFPPVWEHLTILFRECQGETEQFYTNLPVF